MTNVEFGITATIAGMGVTFVTLYIFTLLIRLMNRIFPPEPEQTEDKK